MAGFLCGRGGILAGLPAAIPAKLSDCRARRLRAAPRVARRLVPGSPLWALVLDGAPPPLESGADREHSGSYAGTGAAVPRDDRYGAVRHAPGRSPDARAGPAAAQAQAHETAVPLQGRCRRGAQPVRRSGEAHRPAAPGGGPAPGARPVGGDLIKGRLNRSRVGTLVERKTLFAALVKLDSGSAQATADGFAGILNRFEQAMRRSMTYDQGREMAQHRLLPAEGRHRHRFRPHPRPMGARPQRKHQRPAAGVPAQRRRPQPLLPAATRRYRLRIQR